MFNLPQKVACERKYKYYEPGNHNSLLDNFTSSFTKDPIFVKIQNRLYEKNLIVEETHLLAHSTRRDWHFLQNELFNDGLVSINELERIREEITTTLSVVIQNLSICESADSKNGCFANTLSNVRTLLNITLPISELSNSSILKLLPHNNTQTVIYQYFHAFLDLQYLVLVIFQVCEARLQLESHIKELIVDLVTLGSKTFALNQDSTFVCNCIKGFWLFLQVLVGKNLGETAFWPLIDKPAEKEDSKFVICLLKDLGTLQNDENVESFTSEWLENNFARNQPNYSILEKSLKDFVAKAEFQAPIIAVLKAIQPLVCDSWAANGRIEVFQILWDFFSKRLSVVKPNNRKFAMIEIFETINLVAWSTNNCEGEFELFVSMLHGHLLKHPHHWGKMKGRIYSQLGPNKVRDLSEDGIFNVLMLFSTLSRINFDELVKKFCGFVEMLPDEKKQSSVLFGFYSAFMYSLVQEEKSIEAVAPTFVKILNESADDKKFHLIKTFMLDFDTLITRSENLQLHQWTLFDTYITKYATTCYHTDLLITLNILIKTIDRINSKQVWIEWEPQFKTHIFPLIKQTSSSLSAPRECGILAAKIVVNTPSYLNDAFLFYNDVSMVAKVSHGFLSIILAPDSSISLTAAQEAIALQTWLKTCILMKESNEDLTRKIAQLGILPNFIRSELKSASDPLNTFLECLNTNLDDHLQSLELNKLVETCFRACDRWIRAYLLQPDNEAIVLRLFTCMALACFKIGPLLYDRHKVNCSFTQLVSVLLLPNDLMLGKPLNPLILAGMKKTWHLFYEATLKLMSPGDAFIDMTLRNLVVKYVPYFGTVESPLLKCLDNGALAGVILDKMAAAFFRQGAQEADANVAKALRIVGEFVAGTTAGAALRLVVRRAMLGLLEVMMFRHDCCKAVALGIVRSIGGSGMYFEVRGEFEACLERLAERFLAFHANKYFQLMGVLAKIVDCRGVLAMIKGKIAGIERKSPWVDHQGLRVYYERLEAAVLQSV